MINIESVFLFIGYMNTFWRDSNTVIMSHLHSAFYIYRSKIGAHYRSTLFADLILEITNFEKYNLIIFSHSILYSNFITRFISNQ